MREFLFSNDYFILSFIVFFILSFIVGIFYRKIFDVTGGMPFGVQIIIAAIVSIFWPVLLTIFVFLLPSLVGYWIGEKINNIKDKKVDASDLFEKP